MSFRLPWGGQKSTSQTDVSLDDILPTPSQRTQLVLLVVLCTDRMRDNFTAAFGNSKPKTSEGTGDDSIVLSDISRDLKEAGILAFNRWRQQLLKRMGEVLQVSPNAVKRAKAEYIKVQDAESEQKRSDKNDDAIQDDAAIINDTLSVTRPGYPQYQRITTQLLKLDDQKRALILNSCLFMIVSLETYSAYSRVLLHHVCNCLDLPIDVLDSSESTLALTLLKSASSSEMNADDIRRKKADENVWGRRVKVGLATVAGAALVGVTGGLAAPILLGAAGAIMGGVGLGGLATLLGATIANPVTIAALFGAFGGRMTGNAMEKYSKHVEDFEFVPIRKSTSSITSATERGNTTQKLRVIIGISGWLLNNFDVVDPWQVFSDDAADLFALQYEREALKEFGSMFISALRDSAYSLAQAGALQLALPAVSAAMAPLTLLQVGRLLDNPFSVAMERSDKAGKVLATALMEKTQGERPVILVGYSLGARVIYSCLQELAAQKAFSLVESVVLAGAPVPGDVEVWEKIRAVVVGRVINAYSTNDLILGYLYRTRNAQLNIAGLRAITGVDGVENEDVTTFISGHNQYRLGIGKILREVNFEDIDQSQIEKEEAELRAEDEKEKEIHLKAKSDDKLKDMEDEDGRIMMTDQTEDLPIHDEATHFSTTSERNKEDYNPQPRQSSHRSLPLKAMVDSESEDEEQPENAMGRMRIMDLEPMPESDNESQPDIVKKNPKARPNHPELQQIQSTG